MEGTIGDKLQLLLGFITFMIYWVLFIRELINGGDKSIFHKVKMVLIPFSASFLFIKIGKGLGWVLFFVILAMIVLFVKPNKVHPQNE